jgi:release factor glutamine methyltransferase
MPKINEWLTHSTKLLRDIGIATARLDAEIILAHTIRKSRTYLHAHGDEELDSRQYEISEARLQLRLDRTPIAYIIGHKEFYGRRFKVTPATLIPRPESETIIELLKKTKEVAQQTILSEIPLRLVDIGTGSGCLGITAKLEIPTLDVTLADISNHALKVAGTNAKLLQAEVTILQSNLLEQYPFSPNIIVANLPYVDRQWERSEETKYEPDLALFAEDGGLHLIKKLILEAETRLQRSGYLFLEADPRQYAQIVQFAGQHSLTKATTSDFIIQLQKI